MKGALAFLGSAVIAGVLVFFIRCYATVNDKPADTPVQQTASTPAVQKDGRSPFATDFGTPSEVKDGEAVEVPYEPPKNPQPNGSAQPQSNDNQQANNNQTQNTQQAQQTSSVQQAAVPKNDVEITQASAEEQPAPAAE